MTPEQTLQVKSLVDRSDVFNYVVDHLRRQGKQSRGHRSWRPGAVPYAGVICAYRGDEGAMCAIGALITDDEYDPSWEGISVAHLLGGAGAVNAPPDSLLERLTPHEEMLIELQRFHDSLLSLPDAFEHGRFSESVEEFLLYLREDWDIQ